MTKSLNKIAKKVKWTPKMDAVMILRYPEVKGQIVADQLGISLSAVYNRAFSLGLEKSEAFKASPDASRLRRGGEIGKEFRFKKGQVPPNKGIKGINYPGMVATQFKAGTKPPNHKPVGSTRIDSKDGYILIKMDEGMFKWKLLHRVIWERMHGPIPSGSMVTFVDGNKLNISIVNLTMIDKKQNCKRNSYHNYGKEIANLYQLQGQITRQINKRNKQDERHSSTQNTPV